MRKYSVPTSGAVGAAFSDTGSGITIYCIGHTVGVMVRVRIRVETPIIALR